MIKRSSMVLGVLFFSLIAAGFSSPGFSKEKSSQKEPGPYVANFTYTPDSRKAPGSGGVTFALVGSVYVSNMAQVTDWRSSPQFAQLNTALKGALSELLIAKGFSVRGPFDSYDMIPYSDKKNADLYLIPTLELSATFKDAKVATEGFSKYVYHGTGTIEVNGQLTIRLQEIMTRESMWAKSIPVAYSFPYDVRFPYFTGAPRPFDMGLVMDDLARGMEQQYPKILETLSNLIDTEEMRVIKKQAHELKKKKGY